LQLRRAPHDSSLFPYTTLFRSERVITVGGANAYLPRCVAITEGQSVTFQMNFAVHPLEGGLHKGGEPQPGNPIPTVTSGSAPVRSEEHTSELQSRENLVCRLLL